MNSHSNLLQLAKQGDLNAIAFLINDHLLPARVTAKASIKNNCLQVMLTSQEAPDQEAVVPGVYEVVSTLENPSIEKVKVYGKAIEEDFPAWSTEFEVVRAVPDVLELAQTRDIDAINSLISQSINASQLAIKSSFNQDFLQVLLESKEVPNQTETIAQIKKQLSLAQIQNCSRVKIYSREIGDDFPSWYDEFELKQQTEVMISGNLVATIESLDASLAVEEFTSENTAIIEEKPSYITLAKQGNEAAIANALNFILKDKQISAKVKLYSSCLQVILQADKTLEQTEMVNFVQKFVEQLELPALQFIKVSAWRKGATFQSWNQTIDFKQAQASSWWDALGKAVTDAGGAIGGAASSAGQAVVGSVVGAGEAVGGVVINTGQTVVDATTSAGGAIVSTAMQAPAGVGYLLDFVRNSPHLEGLTKVLQVDWIITIVNQVDIVAAEDHVKQLQKRYPKEKPSDIAHRIMLEKALYVGGSGFVSSLPIVGVPMFAIDLATTTALQAEMVYQIAAAYGLDLQSLERKGEVLAIFGLALGSNFALKAGLGFLRNVPLAGAVIGASSNAVTLYSVGYAACRFYESKINPLSSDEAIAVSQTESDSYLKDAIAQQVIMDQILAHVVAAGNPGKTWKQIFPQLQALNFSSFSLQIIEKNLQNPPDLDSLLKKINQDFAVPLAAQCQRTAQSDGVVTPAESKVIQTIIKQLNVNPALLKN